LSPMKTMSILLLSTHLVISIGCRDLHEEKPGDYFGSRQNPYFPLAVGNRWVYESRDSLNKNTSMIVQVTGYRKIEDQWFAVMDQAMYKDNLRRNHWTRLWSYGRNGEILMHDSLDLLEYTEARKPRIYFDLDGQVGSAWHVWWSGVDSVTFIGRSDSISCSGRWYADCIRLWIEELGWPHDECYAKGVGLIRKTPFDLVRYEIHDPRDGSLRSKY
jgi:hypothetical protein